MCDSKSSSDGGNILSYITKLIEARDNLLKVIINSNQSTVFINRLAMDVDRKPSEDASSISNSSILQSGPIATDIEKSTPALEQTPNDFGPPPDGGYEAWMAVLGGFCTVFASFGWINCIGVFQAYYQSNQLAAYSSSTVAWIPSTETFMLFVMVCHQEHAKILGTDTTKGPVAGKLTDDFGPRIPILVGSILHVFGLMMTSISKEYYQIFLAQSVCSAIGCSFLFYPTIAALGTWFLRHRVSSIACCLKLDMYLKHGIARYYVLSSYDKHGYFQGLVPAVQCKIC